MASSSAGGSSSNSASISVSNTTIGGRKLSRNAPGNKLDPGWKHSIEVPGTKKLKCKYCPKIMSAGVFRVKHHLAGTSKDVEPCIAVPDEVKTEMLNLLIGGAQQGKSLNKNLGCNVQEVQEEDVSGGSDIFKKSRTSPPITLNTIFKKNLREEACLDICTAMYNNGISFNFVNSDDFKKMCESIAKHGPGFKPQSYHECRVKYLKQKYDMTMVVVDSHRALWKKTGCTIMTDGWTDKRRRTIINFCVHSSMGIVFLKSIEASHITKTADKIFKMIDDVVQEIGEENVVQVVTDNAANYKVVGALLMEKRKKIYWTPCAAHCIDLMLEDLEKKIPLHKDTIYKGKKITTYIYSRTSLISILHSFTSGKDLIRPAMTRFATSYLTLKCLHDHKLPVKRMFMSDEWKNSKYAKSTDGKLIENTVMDKHFWKRVEICLIGALPLIEVLRLVDSDDAAMGSIYEAMDRSKEKIEEDFKKKPSFYQPIWDVIDARWERQLHRPLHAAGYYLNPKQHYYPTFKVDYEVKVGLYDCIKRMVGDIVVERKIDEQLEEFKYRRGLFGSTFARDGVETKSPAAWWESYGDGVPELQKLAIRVLSLTCSSSGCERNWSAFEMVHTKKRNRLKQETMNNVVFVMANSTLGKKKHRESPRIDYNFDEIESDDEWIVEPTYEETLEDVEEDQDPLGLDDPNEEEGNLNDLEIPEFISGGEDEEDDIDLDSADLD
ncbi:uncharacterized protein LOC133283732 [Gastrolobium bilobum]|uniref:uncharacterized protein LOC133283732 n=1 Tax=Gastrolobium bilobum TaxID=150636 RepID=UPI002AB27214|nr:uncharacterized protein LOC133283732 [Gastrolobium bilobum]